LKKIPETFNRPLSLLPSRRDILLFLLIGILLYLPVLFFPFVHDDVVFIQLNPQIGNLKNIGALFLQQAVAPQDLPQANPYYRPLLELFYRLEFRLFGLQAWGYHLVNVLFHIGNALLVLSLFRGFQLKNNIATSLALLFLVHPIQTETVVCVAGISNLLASFLLLLSFLSYLRVNDASSLGNFIKILLGILSLSLFGLGLLVKEQVIILPLLLIWYEQCLLAQGPAQRARKIILVMGYGVLTLGYFVLRKIVLGGFLVPLFQYPKELVLRIAAIPATIVINARILLFPFDLHYYRSMDILVDHGQETVSFILLCLAVFAVKRMISRQGQKEKGMLLSFALGWFVLTLLPTLNILPLIHEYSFIAAFEHFLYLPLVGFLLFFGVAYDFATSRLTFNHKGIFSKILVVALFILSSLLTIKQSSYWRAEIPLFERVIKYEPRLGRVRMLLARAYYFAGQYDRAAAEFEIARAIMAGYSRIVVDPAAQRFYRQILRDIYFDLAHCHEAKGDLLKAVGYYQEALEIAPQDKSIINNTGVIYLRLQDFTQAARYFEQVLILDPKDVMARTNLAVCAIQQGKKEMAQRLLREALSHNPDFLPARQNLELLLKGGAEKPTSDEQQN
jgi:protein O-mannosyl-transferase